ncbi:MAG: hypothetical protein Kow0080_12120 [Candidatus Promineifilaceae bacterium]
MKWRTFLQKSSPFLVWTAALLLLAAALRSVPVPKITAVLRGLSPWEVAGLAAVNLLVLMLLNGRWWLLLHAQGATVPFFVLTAHRLAAFAVSYFTPGPHFGGEPVQVALVVRRHGVGRAEAVAAVSLDKALELLVNFGFLAVGLGVVAQVGIWRGQVGWLSLALAAVLLALPVGVLTLWLAGKRPFTTLSYCFRPLIHKFPRLYRGYQQLIHNVQAAEVQVTAVCQRRPSALWGALVVSVLGWLAMIAEFWLMLSFLGLPLSPAAIMIAMTAARVAFLLPLPGGLGTLEASQVLVFAALGLDTAVAVSAVLLIRARDVGLGVLGVLWGLRWLERKPRYVTESGD